MLNDPADDPSGSINVDLVEHDSIVYVRLATTSGGARTHFCLILRWPEAVQTAMSLISGGVEAAHECGADKETINAVMEAAQLAQAEEDEGT